MRHCATDLYLYRDDDALYEYQQRQQAIEESIQQQIEQDALSESMNESEE